MNRKAVIFAVLLLLLLLLVPSANAYTYSEWVSRAFKIGDGKWINLSGQGIGNGQLANVSCEQNCTGFGSGAGDNVTFATLAAMNASSHANRTWTQSIFDWLNITALPAKADATYTNTTLNEKVSKSGDTMTGTLYAVWINDTSGKAYLKNITVLGSQNVTVTQNPNGTITIASSGGGGTGFENPAVTDLNMALNNITDVWELQRVQHINISRNNTVNNPQSTLHVVSDDYTINTGDHVNVASIITAKADRNPAGGGTGGDIWGYYARVNNSGFNASVIGMEIEVDNLKADMPEGTIPISLGMRIYPEHSTYNITRGFDMLRSPFGVGYLTGMYIDGVVNYGIVVRSLFPASVSDTKVALEVGNMKVLAGSIELGGNDGTSLQLTPHLDFKNTSSSDYESRILQSGEGNLNFQVNSGAQRLTIAKDGGVLISALAGSGNAYACINSAGVIYRSATLCV